AYVLLLIRRPGQSLWIPATCTTLALLALSPRLLLQPTCISFLFLGLTLYLLLEWRNLRDGHSQDKAGLLQRRWPVFLVILFAAWANLDPWFFLGPVTVGLYLLGEILQHNLAPVRTGPEAPAPGELRSLGLVLAAGVGACLLNPYFLF